jgi:NAD(P)H-dependent flavin oxidoreductase YrpB (nitropropane dioxygenase family)
VLLNKARETVDAPFIARGGFVNGLGLAAALSLGACGINIGTRFLCTEKAPVHPKIKHAIVQAQETNTVLLLRRWKNTTRLYKSRLSQEALAIKTQSVTGHLDQVAHRFSGRRGRQVIDAGGLEAGVSRKKKLCSILHTYGR